MKYETLISLDRLAYIKNHIQPLCSNLEGDICEIGVYKGGSLVRLAEMFSKKTVYGIDTFEGLPAPTAYDEVKNLGNFPGHKEKDFSDINYEELKENLKEEYKNIILLKGVFPNNDLLKILGNKEFAFVHVDCDLFKSVWDCCEFFYPRLVNRGVMLFDDYGFESTPGAKKAVDEFFSNAIVRFCLKRELPTKQYFVYKLPDPNE